MKDYADIASWAAQNNLGDYNEIIDLMQKDQMIPGYETKTWDIYKGVGKDYGYSEKLSTILDAYAAEFGPTEILI